VCFFLSAREAAGALGTRLSLRPLLSRANGSCKTSGASRRGIAEPYLKIVVVSAQACGLKQPQGGDMTGDQFAALLDEFTRSAESGDGARFAGHFTEDAVYYDYIYGAHQGRADIAHMMQNLFHRDAADYRWEMFDPVFDGEMGYAW
jgi:SnoaL-like domain